MSETKAKKLNAAIEAAEARYERREALFGFEHVVTVAARSELEGMKKARQILFGVSNDKAASMA